MYFSSLCNRQISQYIMNTLRYRNIIYLIRKVWIVVIEVWNEIGCSIIAKFAIPEKVPNLVKSSKCNFFKIFTKNSNYRYFHLSSKAYDISVPQGSQKISIVKVHGLIKTFFKVECLNFSNFDGPYLFNPFRYRNNEYLIWNAWIVVIWVLNENGKIFTLVYVRLILLQKV